MSGKLEPILWKKVSDADFPKNAKNFKPAAYDKFTSRTTATFQFKSGNLTYFLSSLLLSNPIDKNEKEFEGRHFVVVDTKSKI